MCTHYVGGARAATASYVEKAASLIAKLKALKLLRGGSTPKIAYPVDVRGQIAYHDQVDVHVRAARNILASTSEGSSASDELSRISWVEGAPREIVDPCDPTEVLNVKAEVTTKFGDDGVCLWESH